jgi:hypothetical protein
MKSAVLVLFLVSASICLAVPSTNSAPKRFEAEFVGAFGTSYRIKNQNRTLVCSKSHLGNETKIEVTPTKRQWAEFRQTLEKVGAWHWQTNYRNEGVTDGQFWSLTIVYPDRTVQASGVNSYPDENGKPGPDSAYTKAFDTYTRALDKLTGGKFMKE